MRRSIRPERRVSLVESLMVESRGRGRAVVVLGLCTLLAIGATFAVDAGRFASADAGVAADDRVALREVPPGSVVVGVAPEWPFQGFFVPHMGRFWDTGRGRVHETGSQLNSWGTVPCRVDVAVDESAVRLQYWGGTSLDTYGYVIPWGDIAYPVINGRNTPLGTFDASAENEEDAAVSGPGRMPGLRADPRIFVTHVYSARHAVGDEAAENPKNLRYEHEGRIRRHRYGNIVAFRLESIPDAQEHDLPKFQGVPQDDPHDLSISRGVDSRNYENSEGRAGQWYLAQEKIRGFVESSPVMPGQMDPEIANEAVARYSSPDVPRKFAVSATDGRYYGITLWSYSEANCAHSFRAFVVDGLSGEVVGCLGMPSTEIEQPLVFVAAPRAERLERFALPTVPVPTGLDACGHHLDAKEPSGSPFAAVAPRDGVG